jgi:hypothetical protein
MEWLHQLDYLDKSIENKKIGQFDNAASYSSIEHSGLGRYGDPLSPCGDVEALQQLHCMLKSGGILFLGLQCSRDNSSYIVFNAHRVYDTYRLNLLFNGWKVLEQFWATNQIEKIFVLRKK